MSILSEPVWLLIWGMVGLLVTYPTWLLLFCVGCSLAELEPSWGRTFLAVTLSFVLTIGLVLGGYLVGEVIAGNSNNSLRWLVPLLGVGLGVLVSWLLSVLLYPLLLSASLGRGFLAATFERLMGVLLALLIAGVVFVVLALIQIIRAPAPPSKVSGGAFPPRHTTFPATQSQNTPYLV